MLGMLALAACSAEIPAPESTPVGPATNALSAGTTTCVPLDTLDTVPDGVDDNCDGVVNSGTFPNHVSCPYGSHIILGTNGDDVLHGTSGRDCIFGYGGNDTIYGAGGDDVIYGGSGSDRIFASGGTVRVFAGDGADFVDTSAAYASTVYGEAGADILKGGPGSDTFFGGDDNDVLDGGGGHDYLYGDNCHDLLIGGAQYDTGNGGNDFDACDTEASTACERNGSTRVLCSSDTDCKSSERCAVNSGFCVPRTAAACGADACTPTGTLDVTCNGIDDDCDGVIDDDFASQPTACGAGACSATGTTSCVAGVVQDSCRNGAPLPGNDATCDAVDDDCDGRSDEGFVSIPSRCGLGACESSGASSCVGGVVVDSCQAGEPLAPTDTTCDGVDDDCDGTADDDFAASATTCGLGVCARTGVFSCANGAIQDSCVPGQPNAASDDSCNGLDDDCNGAVDDAFVSEATNCGFGSQCARSGATSCVNGAVVDSCHVDCEGECNDGAEDDNDGLIDCADPDCANAVGCLVGSFGSSCQFPSDCDRVGNESICSTDFPGGYCTRPCGAGCPSGTFCLGGIACVVACGPGNHCGRAGFECSPVVAEGLPPDAWCHPTCVFSCPSGTVCDAAASLCRAQ
jgi:hypothetical protein